MAFVPRLTARFGFRCMPSTPVAAFHSSVPVFAGRRWQKLVRDKARNDAQRSNQFTRIANSIQGVVAQGGPDPNTNSLLANLFTKARELGMPKLRIQNAIDKAVSSKNESQWESVLYEASGAHGVMVLVDTLTNNRQRTGPLLRSFFKKHEGNLGNSMWAFKSCGLVTCFCLPDTVNLTEEAAIDLNALDVDVVQDEVDHDKRIKLEILCDSDMTKAVRDGLTQRSELHLDSQHVVSRLTFVPDESSSVTLAEEVYADLMDNFIAPLEDVEGVQYVYHNAVLAD